MSRGRLIVIEGLDGSGKATQAEMLAGYFDEMDKPNLKISFPDYDNPSSTLVKMYLSGEIGKLDEVNIYAASSFYAVDRYISYMQNWKTAYEDGYTIIADRYTTSNAAHQMSKLPESEWENYLGWLEDYEYARMKLPVPDTVLYLDMLPETSRKLIGKRYEGDESKRDIHERDFAYLQKCRYAALYAAGKLNWTVIRCCDGENPLPALEISKKIKDIIANQFLKN